jgi:hypothetical protein
MNWPYDVAMNNPHMHAVKCLRCGRARFFRSAVAAEHASPYGRMCAARIRAAAFTAAVADFTAAQVDKARELLADGALAPVRAGIWQALSSDGVTKYMVAPTGCSCPAGTHGRLCYHVAAARIAAAGKVA